MRGKKGGIGITGGYFTAVAPPPYGIWDEKSSDFRVSLARRLCRTFQQAIIPWELS